MLQLTTVEGSEVDISLGSDDGVKAAEVIKGKLQEYPLAQPLTIVIKAFLKARRLTDVSTGGLGGYALVNMVIAHLQEEAKVGMTLLQYSTGMLMQHRLPRLSLHIQALLKH